jgi:hypothetical protein
MITIPQQLIEAGARFIKIANYSKLPVEKAYHTKNNYSGYDEEILTHIQYCGNYGVLPSKSGLSFMDIDNFDEFEHLGLDEIMPDSFVVRRGNARRGHYYFICPDFVRGENTKPLFSFGDIRFYGDNWFVVGPTCRHPSGDIYNVFRDAPFAILSYDWLLENIIEPFEIKKSKPIVARKTFFCGYSGDSLMEKLGLNMDMFPPEGAMKTENGYRGTNPWHGSTNGTNYTVDLRRGVWYCHRCKSGGGPVEAYAVSRGIIPCSDAGPGCLAGKTMRLYKEREKDGWVNPDMTIEEIRRFVRSGDKC